MDIDKSRAALLFGAFYVLGVLVTAIHLSRFGIYDFDLTKVRYIFAGVTCAFFLLLRIIVTVVIVDLKLIWRTSANVEDTVHTTLKDWLPFRILDSVAGWIARLPVVRHYVQPPTSRDVAKYVVLGFYAVVGAFLIFTYPILVDTRQLPPRPWLSAIIALKPHVPIVLLLPQFAYFLILPFRMAFQSAPLLRFVWNLVFALLLALDVGVYSEIVHPFVYPVFGGGEAPQVRLIPKDDAARNTIKQTTNLHFDNYNSTPVFLIQSSAANYCVTSKYRLNFFATYVGNMIEHDEIYCLKSDLISGYRMVTPP